MEAIKSKRSNKQLLSRRWSKFLEGILAVMLEDLKIIIRKIHTEYSYVPQKKVEEATNLLLRAIIEPCQQLDAGNYLFLITNGTYRYAYDEMQGTYIMYRFDGVLWTCYGAKEDFDCETQDFFTELLQRIYARWRDHSQTSEHKKKWIRISYVDLSNKDKTMMNVTNERANQELHNLVNNVTNSIRTLYNIMAKELGASRVIRACERKMKSGRICEQNDIPAPSVFFNSLDEHDFLIGFKNGIYNLLENRFYERYKIPKAYALSMSVGYDYKPIDDDIRQKVTEVQALVYERIFPHESDRKQINAVVGSLLCIGNPVKKLVLLLGEVTQKLVRIINDARVVRMTKKWYLSYAQGDNGKSAFVSKLLKYTLGDYFATVPIQVLTERSCGSWDGCAPTLCANRKKRCLALNEGDKKMRLNSGMTKTLTGNDEVQFRNLYKQPISARFHATFLYLSNIAPELESGQALWNRTYPIDCIATFEAGRTMDDRSEYLFKRISETEFAMRCKEWQMAHMHLAMEYWRMLHKNNYVLPPISLRSHARYMLQERSEDGIFKRWFFEHYEKIQLPPTKFEDAVLVSHVRLAYNLQVTDVKMHITCDSLCKEMLRRLTNVLIKDQQRVGPRNIRNVMYVKKRA
eukprot:gene207-373_t